MLGWSNPLQQRSYRLLADVVTQVRDHTAKSIPAHTQTKLYFRPRGKMEKSWFSGAVSAYLLVILGISYRQSFISLGNGIP